MKLYSNFDQALRLWLTMPMSKIKSSTLIFSNSLMWSSMVWTTWTHGVMSTVCALLLVYHWWKVAQLVTLVRWAPIQCLYKVIPPCPQFSVSNMSKYFLTNFCGKLQVTVHIKGQTECYECQPKPAPKSYPVCTITSTPSKVLLFPWYMISWYLIIYALFLHLICFVVA